MGGFVVYNGRETPYTENVVEQEQWERSVDEERGIAFDWNWRKWRLLEVIVAADADLLVLEEVDHFADFFNHALWALGYQSVAHYSWACLMRMRKKKTARFWFEQPFVSIQRLFDGHRRGVENQRHRVLSTQKEVPVVRFQPGHEPLSYTEERRERLHVAVAITG